MREGPDIRLARAPKICPGNRRVAVMIIWFKRVAEPGIMEFIWVIENFGNRNGTMFFGIKDEIAEKTAISYGPVVQIGQPFPL